MRVWIMHGCECAFDKCACNALVIPRIEVQCIAQLSAVVTDMMKHFRQVRPGAARPREEGLVDVGTHVHGQYIANVGNSKFEGDFTKASRRVCLVEVRLSNI